MMILWPFVAAWTARLGVISLTTWGHSQHVYQQLAGVVFAITWFIRLARCELPPSCAHTSLSNEQSLCWVRQLKPIFTQSLSIKWYVRIQLFQLCWWHERKWCGNHQGVGIWWVLKAWKCLELSRGKLVFTFDKRQFQYFSSTPLGVLCNWICLQKWCFLKLLP